MAYNGPLTLPIEYTIDLTKKDIEYIRKVLPRIGRLLGVSAAQLSKYIGVTRQALQTTLSKSTTRVLIGLILFMYYGNTATEHLPTAVRDMIEDLLCMFVYTKDSYSDEEKQKVCDWISSMIRLTIKNDADRIRMAEAFNAAFPQPFPTIEEVF